MPAAPRWCSKVSGLRVGRQVVVEVAHRARVADLQQRAGRQRRAQQRRDVVLLQRLFGGPGHRIPSRRPGRSLGGLPALTIARGRLPRARISRLRVQLRGRGIQQLRHRPEQHAARTAGRIGRARTGQHPARRCVVAVDPGQPLRRHRRRADLQRQARAQALAQQWRAQQRVEGAAAALLRSRSAADWWTRQAERSRWRRRSAAPRRAVARPVVPAAARPPAGRRAAPAPVPPARPPRRDAALASGASSRGAPARASASTRGRQGSRPSLACGSSGLRKWALTCTAPASGYCVASTACAAMRSTARSAAGCASGRPSSKQALACAPNSRTWSTVCEACACCTSQGRSALSSSSGSPASRASIAAGSQWPGAVPLVASTTLGRPLARAWPSAKKAATRSSCSTVAGICAASASASGVDREPGLITACAMPHRASEPANRRAQALCRSSAAVVIGAPYGTGHTGGASWPVPVPPSGIEPSA